MNWILENFENIAIAVVVLGSFIKKIMDARTQKSAERDESADGAEEVNEVPLDQDQSYRKVLRPAPVLVTRDPVPPPLPVFKEEAAAEAAQELQHQLALAARLRQIRETKATTSGGAAATRARVAASQTSSQSKSLNPQQPLSLRARVRSSTEVRRAIILREILDRPVSLR